MMPANLFPAAPPVLLIANHLGVEDASQIILAKTSPSICQHSIDLSKYGLNVENPPDDVDSPCAFNRYYPNGTNVQALQHQNEMREGLLAPAVNFT